jgi:hypothetical protein
VTVRGMSVVLFRMACVTDPYSWLRGSQPVVWLGLKFQAENGVTTEGLQHMRNGLNHLRHQLLSVVHGHLPNLRR